MSDEQNTEQPQGQPAVPTLAERVAELHADEPVQDTQAAEPSVESGAATSDAGEPAQPEAAEPADTGGQERAPAEGYDADAAVFRKTFNLASGAPLYELDAGDLAQHPQTSGLPDAAVRAARDQGYAPAGDPQLVHAAADGAKSALTYAVPVAPRG